MTSRSKSKLRLLGASSILVLSAALSACVEPQNEAEFLTTPVVDSLDTAMNPELWPAREVSPARDPLIEKRVVQILQTMSVPEKVGQMIQPELKYVTPADVKKFHIGSVLNGGGTTPNNDKYASVQDWANLAEQFYQASTDESDGKVGIPVIWGSDAVHGNNNVYGMTLFPHNIGLGAAGDPELLYRIGQATAVEVAVTGVDWTFGPTVAVARDIRWGRTYESYSEDPRIVSEYAREMVRGIQGDEVAPGVYKPRNVVATAKHFLGDGGTTQGVDRGDTALSEQQLLNIHAAGYISALDSNVLTTMASFNSWNGKKLHGDKYLLTDILKERMGFDGFVVSDWNGHMQVPGCTVEQCAAAINAGIDLVMVPSDWKAMLANTIKSVDTGEIPMSRIDDAVTRILRVKLRAGLFDAGSVLEREHVGDLSLVGHADHRAIAREAVRKSLVLLKNNDGLLPLSPNSNVLVAGDGANNIGKQAGGWTLSWQGTGNSNKDFPGATSVWDGIKASVEQAGGKAILSEDGRYQASDFASGKPDVAIVVYGEEPYAEWHGDITSIEYQVGSKAKDLELLRRLKQQGIAVVSVFITGRPLFTNREINASDAFVVAWLPGSEGNGVAQVVMRSKMGEVQNDFQGKLSFSWPKNVTQAATNVGDKGYDPLFPYGYGLTYAQPQTVSNRLDESTERVATDVIEESWMFVSREMSDYQFKLADDGAAAVTVNGNREVSAADENLLLLSVDKVAQEDARRLVWSGLRPATVSLAAKHPLDMSQYLDQRSALSFSMKVDVAPKGDVALSMLCGGDCRSSFDFTDILKKAKLGDYVDYKIGLECFAKKGAQFDAVSEAFVMRSTGKLDVAVADIKIIAKIAKDDLVVCD